MSNQKSVESLIKVDKMECGEMFAKFLFENVGANADISSLLGSKTKMEFVMRATAMSDSVKDMDTLRLLVAVVSALPWDVPKEKKGTVEDEKTATYLLVCIKFNYACMCNRPRI